MGTEEWDPNTAGGRADGRRLCHSSCSVRRPSGVPDRYRGAGRVTVPKKGPRIPNSDPGSRAELSSGRLPVTAPPQDASCARLVVFDFDGTLTRPDIFRLFLRQLHTRRRIAVGFLRHLHRLVPAVIRGGTARDRAKERLCTTLLGGLSETGARSAAERTAQMVLGSCLRGEVAERLRWHIGSGDRVIVVSASFEAYVRPVMAALGVHEVIATRWEVDPRTGSLTGRIAGPNVRGMAKVRLLQEHIADAPCVVDVAYGNSQGDAALLATATHPVWVRRYRRLAAPTW